MGMIIELNDFKNCKTSSITLSSKILHGDEYERYYMDIGWAISPFRYILSKPNCFYNSFKFNNLTFKDVKHRESTALVFCMNKNYNTLKRLTKIKYALVDFSDKSYLRNNTEEELPYEDEEDYKFQRYMNSLVGQRRMFQLFYMTERRKIYERKISQLFQKAKSIRIE